MKIRSVEATPYTIPYAHGFKMATGALQAAEHVLVRIHTDEGPSGIAEAVSRPMIYGESQPSIVFALTQWVAPLITGLDPFAVEEVAMRLRGVVNNNTAKGAVDIALHDLQGKILGRSCWQLLGAARPAMEVSCMLSLAEPARVAEEALGLREEFGITSFKVKIDADVDAAVAAVAAVRDALGPDALLYADANGAMRADQAHRTARLLEDSGLAFLEDPTDIADHASWSRLADTMAVPIMADEAARDLTSATNALRSGRAQAVSVKTARTGFTESRKIVGAAEGMHARTVIGSQGDAVIGAAAALCFGAAQLSTAVEPGELAFFHQLADDIATERPAIRDGRIQVPTELPGIGASVDEDKLRHYRVDD